MSRPTHIIKRQVVALQTRGEMARIQSLQAEVGRLCRQRIVSIIDECCSTLTDPDCIHRIDTLEVDLGYLDVGRLAETFPAKFHTAFRAALEKKLEVRDGPGQGAGPDVKIASNLELFTVFIETGSLPWWVDTAKDRILETCLDELLDNAPGALRETVLGLVRNARALQRLTTRFDTPTLRRLCCAMIPGLGDAAVQVLSDLARATSAIPQASKRSFLPAEQKPVWTQLLLSAASGGRPLGLDEVVELFLTRAGRALNLSFETTLTEVRRVVARRKEGHRRGALEASLARLSSNRERSHPMGSPHVSPLPAGARAATTTDAEPAAQHSARPFNDVCFSDTEALYIDNAGLVILWPFLKGFFERLQLIEAGRFKTPASGCRAVGLLQHLATFDTAFPEYLLPLCKVLCGLDVDDVFAFEPPLTDEERDACEGLLAAVIAQAAILRQMTTTGFRGTFLLRQGILSRRDGAWLLQVERQAYDVVLDKFPWSWTWLKTPFMADPMRVEW